MHKQYDDSCLNGVQLNMFNSHTGVKVRRLMTTNVVREISHLAEIVNAIRPLFALLFRFNEELFCLIEVATLTDIAVFE